MYLQLSHCNKSNIKYFLQTFFYSKTCSQNIPEASIKNTENGSEKKTWFTKIFTVYKKSVVKDLIKNLTAVLTSKARGLRITEIAVTYLSTLKYSLIIAKKQEGTFNQICWFVLIPHHIPGQLIYFKIWSFVNK